MEIAIAVSTTLLAYALLAQSFRLLTRRQRRLHERLKLASGQVEQMVDPVAAVSGGTPARKFRFRLPVIPALGSVVGGKYLEKIRVNLTKAGIPLKPEELAGMAAVLALAGAGIGMMTKGRALLAALMGSMGAALPGLWVAQVRRRRSGRLEAQLVDSLSLMANSLRAGHSFMQAIEVASRDMSAPLAPELARVLKEARLGVSLDDAFRGLVGRFDSKDLELATTGVLIQRQVGGNLAQVLDTIASTVEKRLKARAKIRTLTAQGRLTAWVVSLLPFAVGGAIFTLYPEFGRIMLSTPAGVGMLAAGGVLLVIGVFAVRKVVNIDV